MCARCVSATDTGSKAHRSARRPQSCRGRTADVVHWPGSPARATLTAEDAAPGPPGRLVVRACFVCRTYSECAYP
eukprot:5430398-Prymnesium_polylepis.1